MSPRSFTVLARIRPAPKCSVGVPGEAAVGATGTAFRGTCNLTHAPTMSPRSLVSATRPSPRDCGNRPGGSSFTFRAGRTAECERSTAPSGPAAQLRCPRQLGACKVRPRIRVLHIVQGNSMRWGLDELSSTHAPHRPMRPTLVPRVIPTRANVANAVGPEPSAFYGGPSCPKATEKWCL